MVKNAATNPTISLEVEDFDLLARAFKRRMKRTGDDYYARLIADQARPDSMYTPERRAMCLAIMIEEVAKPPKGWGSVGLKR